MKKNIRILAAALAVVLSFGLLSACGNTTPVTPVAPVVPGTQPAGNDTTAPAVDLAELPVMGRVHKLEEYVATMTEYTCGNEITNYAFVDVDTLIQGENTVYAAIDPDAKYYYIVNGSLVEADQSLLTLELLIAVTENAKGEQVIYLLDYEEPVIIDTPYDETTDDLVGEIDEYAEETTEATEEVSDDDI